MLTHKDIEKIRKMYYEQHYTVTEITRILKISRNTCYKYLKFINFNAYIKENKRAHYLDQYKEVLLSLIKKDSLHHHKQRYTGTRAYEYLVENYPDFKYAKTSTIKYFTKLKKEFYYEHNGFLPLDHKAGEAQVDLGECSFIEKGEKIYGKYLVMTFTHSNASYIQLLKNKNAESIVLAIRHIFEYLNGVPHTIWFDNDSALVKIENLEHGRIRRIIGDTFNRFKLHYDFNVVFLNVNRGYEKGTVEQGIRYMRRNLLVPLPSFDDFDKYNFELLDKSKQLMKREHYVLRQPIIDLHFEDITELNPLPPTPFDASSVSSRKLDNYGRLTTDNRHYYYLSPSLAYEKVQVKYLPEQLEIYYDDGRYIMTVPRMNTKPGARYINWSPYIRLLADKPAAMYNFSFLDLFEGNNEIIEKITKLDSIKLREFLLKFADMIDKEGLSKTLSIINCLI